MVKEYTTAIPYYVELQQELSKVKDENLALKNENDALRAAHVFYGNAENYNVQKVNNTYSKPQILLDRGATARKILKECN